MAKFNMGKANVKQRLGNKLQPLMGSTGNKPTVAPILKGNDARFKLITKKRLNIKDARDRLGEIAKQGDARVKINNLKKIKGITSVKASNGVAPQNRKNSNNQLNINRLQRIVPLSKTIQGITTSSGQAGFRKNTRMMGGLQRTIKGGTLKISTTKPKAMPALVQQATDLFAERYHPLPSNPNVVTIKNERVQKPQKQFDMKRSSQHQQKVRNMNRAPQSQQSRPPVRHEIPRPLMQKTFKGSPWRPEGVPYSPQQEIKPTRLKITTPNNYMDYDAPPFQESWSFSMDEMNSMNRPYNDRPSQSPMAYGPAPPMKKPTISNVISRLDQQQSNPRQNEFKVIVTNLHAVVSVDDVEELFRNIGPIKEAVLLCKGMAEVVFYYLEDAFKSVEVYNNRQLDGQPMHVTVMNDATQDRSQYNSDRSQYNLPLPTAARSFNSGVNIDMGQQQSYRNDNRMSKSVLRTAGGSTYAQEMPVPLMGAKRQQSSYVSPDVNAIHHALFSGRSTNVGSNMHLYDKNVQNQQMRGGGRFGDWGRLGGM